MEKNTMPTKNSLSYEYDDLEQARMARDTIKKLIEQFGDVLKQRRYYQLLEEYFKLLNKDVGEQEVYID